MTDTANDAALARHNGNGAAARTPAQLPFAAVAQEQWKIAEAMAKSDIIPKDFRGKPANIFVALEMAHRLNLGPMEAMQNLYVVHGTPSMSAKFLIALANRSQRFKGGLQFREAEDAVTCFAVDRETGESMEVTVTMAQAKKAGWTKNAKYVEMGQQMLAYRAATFFVRRYCPEVALGFVTVEEAQEMPREVPLEEGDPLDAALAPAPVDAPEEPQATEAEEVPQEPKAPTYAPQKDVDALVEAFSAVGLDRDAVDAEYGPLDQMTPEMYQRARAAGKQMKRDLEEQQANETPF